VKKIEEQTKKFVSIQAAYEKVPNVATLSDGFVRVVANDIAQQKTLQLRRGRKILVNNGGRGWSFKSDYAFIRVSTCK